MEYYHVLIKYSFKERTSSYNGNSFTKEELTQRYVNPYNENKPFFIAGRKVYPEQIEEFLIFRTFFPIPKDLILPNGQRIYGADYNYIKTCFMAREIDVDEVTGEFLIPSEKKEIRVEKPTEPIGIQNKIFIVHGRDEASALLLQRHLSKKGIDAEMFEDFKERITGNITVIEELVKIKDEVGYVFVIATPDDLGNLHEEIENYINNLVKGKPTVDAKDVCAILDKLNFKARQNVVFEYGLFLGVLGREKVQCLWNKKIGDEPSDIKGVLNIQFEKSIKETFTEIDAKLQKLGLIKK